MKRWVTWKGRTDLEGYSALPADLQQRIQAHIDAVWEWKREERLKWTE